MNLERPDYTQYASKTPEKLFLRSQGRCICKSSRERKDCLNYERDADGSCRHLDKVLWIACLWRGNE